MPYIGVKTAVPCTEEKLEKLQIEFGKIVTTIPGKSEARLMFGLTNMERMAFGGSNEACAFVEVRLLGTSTREVFTEMTGQICNLLKDELGIPTDRTFVQYQPCEYWGFDNILF